MQIIFNSFYKYIINTDKLFVTIKIDKNIYMYLVYLLYQKYYVISELQQNHGFPNDKYSVHIYD